jgi:hypothetical protein
MVKDSLSRRTFGADDDDDVMASFPYNFRYAVITNQNTHMQHVVISMLHRHHIAIAAAASPFGSARVIPGCRVDHRNSESQRGR